MTKPLKFLIIFSFLLLLPFFGNFEVNAQCDSGTCLGETRLDWAEGCEQHDTGTYCIQTWTDQKLVSCPNLTTCTYIRYDWGVCLDWIYPECDTTWQTTTGGCCDTSGGSGEDSCHQTGTNSNGQPICGGECSNGGSCGRRLVCVERNDDGECIDWEYECRCSGGSSCTSVSGVNITANGSDGPITVQTNQFFALSWSSSNATSCTLNCTDAGGTSCGSASVPTTSSDPNYSRPSVGTYAYSLNCSNSCSSGSDTVTVNVIPRGFIQGRKGMLSVGGSLVQAPPAILNTISSPAFGSTTANPYSFGDILLDGETHPVSATNSFGYEVSSDLCYSDTSCHNPPTSNIPGGTRDVLEDSMYTSYDPGGGDPAPYADLYWYYTPLPRCNYYTSAPGQNPTSIILGETGTYQFRNNIYDESGVVVSNDVAMGYTTDVANPNTSSGVQLGTNNCGDTATCDVQATINPQALGMDIGDQFYVYCRGWNDSLHECNPFHDENVASRRPHPADIDCDQAAGSNTDRLLVSVANPDAWWQVVGAGAAAGGVSSVVSSDIPVTCVLPGCNPSFMLNGPRGNHGVTSMGGNLSNFGSGSAGETPPPAWLAEGAGYATTALATYTYDFFERKIPNNTTVTTIPVSADPLYTFYDIANFRSATASTDGYAWFMYDAGVSGKPLRITNTSAFTNLNGRKIVLFVKNAGTQFATSFGLTDGTESFVLISEDFVSVDPGIGTVPPLAAVPGTDPGPEPNLEGLIFTEGNFQTGTQALCPLGPPCDNVFVFRGMVAAKNGVDLQRSLADNSETPAEVFMFAPDLVFAFPQSLGFRDIRWQEVAP